MTAARTLNGAIWGFASSIRCPSALTDSWQRSSLAKRFQGLHIDKPFYYRIPRTDLNIGMNAITWGTLIGGRWLESAGDLTEPNAHQP